jgi:long-chain fatty acid transport protein
VVTAGICFGWVLCQQVSATGFYINQQSVRGLGRVDAGNTVTADDLATVFFNPAGLIKLWAEPQQPRIQFSLGGHLIIPRADQVNRLSLAATPGTLGAFVPISGGNAHNATPPSPVLNLYMGRPLLGERAAIGMGVTFPFGLTTRFDRDWHGRYDATEASLLTANLGAVAAWRVTSRVSVGGGVDVQYAGSILESKIPNPLVPGGPTATTDGTIKTKGHAVTPGFNAGILFDVTPASRIGVHYRSAMKHDIAGHSTISGLTGPLAAFNGRVEADAALSLPAITTVGGKLAVTTKVALLGEFEWFDWSTFKEVRIRFGDGRPDGVRPANYRDAYAVAVGAEYSPMRRWTARGGVHYDTTPTVDGFRDTTVPDADRLWLGVGASWQRSRRVGFDVAFNHVFFRDTAIALSRSFFDDTPLATAVRINSDVSSVVNTVSIAMRVALR